MEDQYIAATPIQEHYKLEPRRWYILAFFSLCLINTHLLSITFSPIVVPTAKAFGVSTMLVNMCGFNEYLIFFCFTFLVVKLFSITQRHYVLRLGVGF
jgi:hypothetical protein